MTKSRTLGVASGSWQEAVWNALASKDCCLLTPSWRPSVKKMNNTFDRVSQVDRTVKRVLSLLSSWMALVLQGLSFEIREPQRKALAIRS